VRSQRLTRITQLLAAHGQLTAGELAGRLAVSARTIQRDLEALSLAGVPVYATRGPAGGWALAPGYRPSVSGFTPDETITVFVGRPAPALADLGLDVAASSAEAKLLSSLPPRGRRDAEFARQRVLLDHAGWSGPGPATPWLAVLQQALWQDVRVRIRYGNGPAEVTVAPLGLIAKGSTWYLLGQRDDGQQRTYRLPRITSAVPTGQRFDRPADFDLAAQWQEACARFAAGLPAYPARLRVRTDAVRRLSWAPGVSVGRVGPDVDGWSEVTMTFESLDELAAFLLGLAGRVRVEEPGELRTTVVDAARSLLALYPDAERSRAGLH
jgi:predicted DNA-binding transcriptional regulator YafY